MKSRHDKHWNPIQHDLPPHKPASPITFQIIQYWLSRRWAILLTAFFVLAALVAYYPNVADDFDIWWHLEYGRHFVQQRTWTIDHSVFSWTPADAGWMYVSWIGSSLLYLAYQAGGYPALTVLQWLIFGGMVFLFCGFVRLCKSEWTVTHLAAVLLTGIAMNPIAIYIKPELFTLLFFTLAVWVYFASKVTAKNLFWIYPPLFLVWVNTHGGFINGLGFVALALLAEVAAYVFRHPGRMPQLLLRKFALYAGLAFIVTLINPHGFAYGIQIFQNAAAGGTHIQSVTAYLPLWQFLFPAGFPFRKTNTAWAMTLMAVILLVLAGAARIRRKQSSPPVLVLNLLFFVFGFAMFRASIYFCILWVFSVHYLDWLGAWRLHRRLVIPAFCLAGLVSGMIIYEIAVYNIYDSWFGSRIANFLPAAETEFTAQHKLPGPLFNDYLAGGYLIWAWNIPHNVFIDSRYGPYESTGVWKDYLALFAEGHLRLLDSKYRCNTAIINAFNNYRITDMFLESPEWALVYFNLAGAVFVRKSTLKDQLQRDWQVDMRPERFKDISNPRILITAFFLYCHYHPSSAPQLLAYYEKNVRIYYRHKPMDIRRMKTTLRQLGLQYEKTQVPSLN